MLQVCSIELTKAIFYWKELTRSSSTHPLQGHCAPASNILKANVMILLRPFAETTKDPDVQLEEINSGEVDIEATGSYLRRRQRSCWEGKSDGAAESNQA
jgi:hypothetical protein